MKPHKTCLDPPCDARQPDCPWPDAEVRRPIVQYNPLCAKGFGPYCRDCELEMVCGEPDKKEAEIHHEQTTSQALSQ